MVGRSVVVLAVVLAAGCTSGGPARQSAAPTSAVPARSAGQESSAAASKAPSSPTTSRRSASVPPVTATPTASPSATAAIDYARSLAAITDGGDIVLVEPDTAAVLRTVIRADVAAPAVSVAWDAANRLLYFGRGGRGLCASVWRHRLGEEPVFRLAAGHHPVVSPDGKRLALARGCDAAYGESTGVSILDARTGAPILELPIMIASPTHPEQPRYVTDIDWRPDGGALVVTLGWAGSSEQRLVDVRRPPKSVSAGKLVVVRPSPPQTNYPEIEFAGDSMVVAGRCCPTTVTDPSARLFTRDPATGVLTALATGEAVSLTAATDGRLRYIAARSVDHPGPLWGRDGGGKPREIGGSFRAVGW